MTLRKLGWIAVASLVTTGAVALAAAKTRTFYVHESKVFVMEKPRRFARKLGDLQYLDPVTVVGPLESGWYPVEFKGKVGYLPYQAVTVGEPPNSVARDRTYEKRRGRAVQLAARGFGPDVESAYRKDHPDLDYDAVDAMEVVVPDPGAVRRFALAGGLDITEPKEPPEPSEEEEAGSKTKAPTGGEGKESSR